MDDEKWSILKNEKMDLSLVDNKRKGKKKSEGRSVRKNEGVSELKNLESGVNYDCVLSKKSSAGETSLL